MYTCKYCGKEFEKRQSMASHTSHCPKNPNKKRTFESTSFAAKQAVITTRKNNPYRYEIKEFYSICKSCGKKYTLFLSQEDYDKGKYSKYCSRSCANRRIHTEETKDKISQSIKQYNEEHPSINKSVIHICKVCKKEYILSDCPDVKNSKFCSLTCKQSWMQQFYSTCGGYRKGSGRGKGGWYKNIYCDSSWELAFVIYHLDNNLYIERCKEKRKYIFNGEEHTYIPDFVTDDGIIEIKGYTTEQWKSKEIQNPDIKVLYKKEIKPYIDYAISKYGKNYIELYNKK